MCPSSTTLTLFSCDVPSGEMPAVLRTIHHLQQACSGAASSGDVQGAAAGTKQKELGCSWLAGARDSTAGIQRLQRSLGPDFAEAHAADANAATLVPLLRAHAWHSTPRPLVVFLTSNVSLSSADALGGIQVNRPLVLLGSTQRPTSIDFGMSVNQFDLTGSPHSNITLDSLVLENLASGDAESAAIAAGTSLSVTASLWQLRYERQQLRAMILDCVAVVPSPSEIDYLVRGCFWLLS